MKTRYFTMKDVIALLGVTKNTIINWEESGKIPSPKRDPIFGYRLWTENELDNMRELSKEIKGRVLETYRGQKIYVSCAKEDEWIYRFIIFNYGKTENRTKMFSSKDKFTTKEEALENAKKSIIKKLALNAV